jgi:hypothetical protein
MTLRNLLLIGLALCAIFQADASAQNASPILNVVIASGLYANAEQGKDPVNDTIALLNELDSRNLNTSIFLSGDMSVANPLYATLIGSKPNHELAISGKTAGEDLSQLSDSDLNVRLLRVKADAESNYICGSATMKIRGYLPEPGSLKPGSIPYKTLEGIGLTYIVDDSGYTGTNGTWPQQAGDQSLYVVPVSTGMVSGKNTYMTDVSASKMGLNGTQWYDVLAEKFNETSSKGEPLVVVFHNTLSGSGEYLDAYSNFINYTASKKSKFLTSTELVEMGKSQKS